MDDKNKKLKIGLALSGGGYRAAAFHLGTLKKLKELDILERVDIISAISGGSIAAAYYGLNKGDFKTFVSSFEAALQKSVKRRIIWSFGFLSPFVLQLVIIYLIWAPFSVFFPSWLKLLLSVLIIPALVFFQFKILPLTNLKIKAYKKLFFKKNKLSDLPSSPIIAINSTNLETGTLWTFSKEKTSDSSYEYYKDRSSIKFNCTDFFLAKAVACSTCVPFPFNPVTIEESYFINKSDYKRIKPRLVDGGLYDNQGIHKLTEKSSSYSSDIVIVSDGSFPFKTNYLLLNSGTVLYRATDVMMRKIKNMQFIRDVYSKKMEIAYFSLDWTYLSCISGFISNFKKGNITPELKDYHKIPSGFELLPGPDQIKYMSDRIGYDLIIKEGLSDMECVNISNIKTDLAALTKNKIDLLSRHAGILTEIQIKLYCPTLIKFE